MQGQLERRLKISHLRTVEALVRHGSLLKAAQPIGVTQPALTRTLHEVEDLLGQALFERTSRGVRASNVGRLVATVSSRILSEIRRLETDLENLTQCVEGTLTIGTPPASAAGVLPGALQSLRSSSPGIRTRLEHGRTDELLPLLESGEVDLVVGLLFVPAVPDDFRREAIWSERTIVVARADHPLLDGRTATPSELRRYGLVLPVFGQRVGREIERALTLLGLDDEGALRSNSAGFLREMLYGTDMIAVMPQMIMAGDLKRSTLRSIPLSVDLPAHDAGVILTPGRPLGAAAFAFVEALRSYVASVPGVQVYPSKPHRVAH